MDVLIPANQDSGARAGALCKKIAALESLAANSATTAPEAESARKAAERLRLQLTELVAATEAASGSEQASDPSLQGTASGSDTEPLSSRPTPMWLWALPVVALVGVLLVLFWPRGNSPVVHSSEPPTRGTAEAATAEAQRACRIRDVVKEFQKTPGGVLHSNEDAVDVRRRCGAYLSIRGFDEEACSPSADGKPFPQCPTPE